MGEAENILRSWVDTPTEATPPSRYLIARGWCYHRGGERVLAVRARIGGKIQTGCYGIARPDVQAAFGEPGCDVSGFEIPLSLPLRSCEARLEAQLGNGTWEPFHTLSLKAPGKSALGERWRWLRFWSQAWSGNPKAWALLTEPEHEHMLHSARERGWTTLDRFGQYEPRPVLLEKFPKTGASAKALPKFTIATPSFNHAEFIGETMRNVLGQEGVRVDYIVQDGASKDASAEQIRKIAEEHGARGSESLTRVIHWASEPDKGQSDAIRRAFEHTDCGPDDIMGYLNSDDLLMPGTLRFVAEFFAKHPEVDAVYGHRVNIDEKGREIGRWVSPRLRCDNLKLHDLVPQETLFWRKRIWDRIGGIDTSFQFAMDWDLLLRMKAVGARFERIPRFMGLFRVHPKQKTQSWIGDVGIKEMERLRARSLGRAALPGEPEASLKHALFDSALVYALWKRGWRV